MILSFKTFWYIPVIQYLVILYLYLLFPFLYKFFVIQVDGLNWQCALLQCILVVNFPQTEGQSGFSIIMQLLYCTLIFIFTVSALTSLPFLHLPDICVRATARVCLCTYACRFVHKYFSHFITSPVPQMVLYRCSSCTEMFIYFKTLIIKFDEWLISFMVLCFLNIHHHPDLLTLPPSAA